MRVEKLKYPAGRTVEVKEQTFPEHRRVSFLNMAGQPASGNLYIHMSNLRV